MSCNQGDSILTVENNEKIDSKDSKTFADFVVCVLKLALHDGGVYFDDDDRCKTGQDHTVEIGQFVVAI